MPKGYWIVRVDVADQEKYKAYVEANAVAFKKYGARFLVRGGKFENPEGAARARLDATRRTRKPRRAVSVWLHRTSALYRTVWTGLENARLRRVVAQTYRDTFHEDSEAWQATVRELVHMRDTVEARHVPFLVVVIPFFDEPLDEAVAIFEFNLELHPQSAYSYDGLADVADERGDTAGAIAFFEKSIALDPSNTYAADGLARLRR